MYYVRIFMYYVLKIYYIFTIMWFLLTKIPFYLPTSYKISFH